MKKLLILAIFLSLFYCKKETEEARMVVTSVYGDVLINENNGVHVGQIVKQTDIVRTENGKVTLQSREGATILVKEFTKIRVASLNKKITNIETVNGSMLIRVSNKLDTGSEFNIVTPTAVAGVRGTTFFVYSSRESTIFNSIEGPISVGRNSSQGTIIEKKSVEIGSSGTEKVVNENYIPSVSEVTDIVTLVTISKENVDRAAEGDVKGLETESEEKVRKAEKEAIEIIRSPNYSSTRNSEVIKSAIVLKNGSRIKGNVIYQTNEKIFVLTENRSIQEFEKNTVSSIDFF